MKLSIASIGPLHPLDPPEPGEEIETLTFDSLAPANDNGKSWAQKTNLVFLIRSAMGRETGT